MIKAILACDQNWGIGKNGTLPWPHNSADQKWFANTTKNGIVVMGRTTWNDPDMPKPLPGRLNVVVTRSVAPYAHLTINSIEEAMHILPDMDQGQVWIIGGAKLLLALMPIIDELHLSRMHNTYNCDTFLPEDEIQDNYTLSNIEDTVDLYIETWTKNKT